MYVVKLRCLEMHQKRIFIYRRPARYADSRLSQAQLSSAQLSSARLSLALAPALAVAHMAGRQLTWDVINQPRRRR